MDTINPSLVEREQAIFRQIGLDMRQLKMSLNLIIGNSNASGNPQAPWPPVQPIWLDDQGLLRIDAFQVTQKKRDLALMPRPDGALDLALAADGDLLADNGLHTAILTSLFSDARHDRQRGWWADSVVGRVTGSRIWVLRQEGKQQVDTLRRAEQYTAESLQWLLDDRIAEDLAIAATWSAAQRGYMHLGIKVLLRNGGRFV
ncbi:hypothetical protein E6Q11_00265 [Candidatus Dojkabacteria bacterium]|uniref:Uncharacterized protein n=1 Tax=Candidatus Dojkabacteria bacterium TaxID=2099670 RepID=A0A5C7JEC6_9BACT|nr:MAG: hypothetical protein E6Q11_00265 [Candidatus Dojkabacteria bacterium]